MPRNKNTQAPDYTNSISDDQMEAARSRARHIRVPPCDLTESERAFYLKFGTRTVVADLSPAQLRCVETLSDRLPRVTWKQAEGLVQEGRAEVHREFLPLLKRVFESIVPVDPLLIVEPGIKTYRPREWRQRVKKLASRGGRIAVGAAHVQVPRAQNMPSHTERHP